MVLAEFNFFILIPAILLLLGGVGLLRSYWVDRVPIYIGMALPLFLLAFARGWIFFLAADPTRSPHEATVLIQYGESLVGLSAIVFAYIKISETRRIRKVLRNGTSVSKKIEIATKGELRRESFLNL